MSTTTTTTAINRARYSARDFDTLFDDMRQFLEDRYGAVYNDFQASSQGVMLMDLLAHSLEQLHWYMDRRASEAYLDTCRLMSSASRLTRQQGYRMAPATSSSVTLTVAPRSAQSFAFPIPVGFKFKGPENKIFEVTEQVTFPAGSTAAQPVSVREGETFRVSATSDGTGGQEVVLASADNETTFLIDGSVRVFVDGAEWTEVDFLEFGLNNQFEVHYHEQPPIIRFGNGISGKIPDATASIRVTYAVNRGEQGNVGSGTITAVSTPLVYRFTTIPLTVNNTAASSGGKDPESVEEARRNAPRWFGARNRAVTREDYEVLAGTFSSPEYGSIAAASAFVAREVAEDLEASGYINDILGEVASYQTAISGFVADAQSSRAALDAHLATAQTERASVNTKAAVIASAASAIATTSASSLAQASFLSGVDETLGRVLSSDGEWAFDIDDLIAHLTSRGGSSIPYATDLTNNWKPAITSAQQTVQSVKSTIESNAAAERANAGTASVEAAAILLTTGTGGAMGSALSGAQTRSSEVSAELVSIGAEIPLHNAAITVHADNLKDHLTSVLGDDCQANLITVPVLAFNGDGDYQAPSQALMNELERYLTSVADVAHVVNVVSAEGDLIAVSIDVHLKQSDGYVFSEVASEITIQLTAEMKKRPFGVSLYLNKAYLLANTVVGVRDLDITFSAASEYMDAAGNVICPSGKVLVLGSLTISNFA
jgi:hypothetical protein